jgi:hypothetical protein
VNAAQVSLKSMRVIHLCFLLTVVVYVWVPSMIIHEKSKEFPVVFVVIFGVISLTSTAATLFFLSKLVRPAAEQLRQDGNDKQAAGRWRAGLILSFAFSETVILFGLALRILNAPWAIAGIFYGVGALLLLACTPKLELLPE